LHVEVAPIQIAQHVPIGSGSIVLPGVTIGEGAAVAAMSLVNRRLEPWIIYGGNPIKELRARSPELLSLEKTVRNLDDPA
jgi:galactoside O-acetyltransferase